MKTKLRTDYPELAVSSTPSNFLDVVRSGNAGALTTTALNVFYVLADYMEKHLKSLKEACRPVIISRRDEGVVTGAEKQHREFTYQTPTGHVKLTIQQRIVQRPDLEQLQELLEKKNLLEQAMTTSLDMEKVDGLRLAGLITPEEFDGVSEAAHPVYALIPKFDPTQ